MWRAQGELFGELLSFRDLECYDVGKTEVSGRHGGVRKTQRCQRAKDMLEKHGKNKKSWRAFWRALLKDHLERQFKVLGQKWSKIVRHHLCTHTNKTSLEK